MPDPIKSNDQKPDELGPGGKAALDAERAARREAERRANEATDRAAKLEAAELRRTVAAAKGLSDAQAKFLAGDDAAAMEKHADELLEAFKPPEQDRDTRRRPQENLRTGATGATDAEPTMGQVAESILGDY